MGTWKTYKLGDVAKFHDNKRIPLSSLQRQEHQGAYPYYGAACILDYVDGYLFDGDFILVGEDGTVITPEGKAVVQWVTGKFWVNNHAHVITARKDFSQRFLYYLLSEFRIGPYVTGAAQPKVSKGRLEVVKISLPPLEEQERIAGVLGAYDDLIAVNERQMALLEEAAHRLYRAYFATHADPDWEQKPLGEVATLDPSIPLSKSAKEPRFVAMEALSEHSMLVDVYHAERRKARGGSRFQNGDSLLARISPCLENGKTGFVMGLEPDEVAIGSTEFIVFREKVWGKHMLYCLLRTPKFRIHAKNSLRGADGRQRAQTTFLAEYQVPNPPPNVIADFEAQVSPYFEAIGVLARENVLLREGRDKLLPRLLREEA